MIRTEILLAWMWGALGVYWLASALRTKKIAVNEASSLRIFRLLILALTFILLLTPWLRVGPLGRRFVPDSAITRDLGMMLAVAGSGLSIWARHHLGEYWSDKVALKADHQLIGSGPYAHLRHPIYSGVLLGVAGTALSIGEWRGVVALVVLGTNYFVKAKREERVLAAQFGEAFVEYQRRAGFFVPWW